MRLAARAPGLPGAPFAAALVLGALLSGCGESSTPATVHDTGPFRTSLSQALSALERVAPQLRRAASPAAIADRSLPHPVRSTSVRTESTTLDLLLYRSPAEALRARASVREALSGHGSQPIFKRHNLLAVVRQRGADTPRLRTAIERLGGFSSR